MPSRGKLENIQTRSIYFYLFISLHSTHSSQPTHQTGTPMSAAHKTGIKWIHFVLSRLILARNWKYYSQWRMCWWPSSGKFSIVLWSNHVDCRPVRSININMLVMVMVTYSFLHIRSQQMSPQHQTPHSVIPGSVLSRLTGSWFSKEICTLRLIARVRLAEQAAGNARPRFSLWCWS